MKEKISVRTWLAIIIVGFAGQVAWAVENMYLNKFLFFLIGDGYLTYVPITVAASAITACITTILIGSLSDKIGHRKTFIVVGYILWGISTAAFGLISQDNIQALLPLATVGTVAGITTVVLDCVMTFFGSTANDAAYNSYITRTISEKNRGKVEGVVSVLPLFAMLLIFVGLNSLTDGENAQWDIFFYIIGGLVFVVGIAAIFLLKKDKKEKNSENMIGIVLDGFKPRVIKENKILYIIFLAYLVYGISTQIFFPYLMIYFEYNLEFSGTDFSIVLGVVLIVGSILSVLFGMLSDKINKFIATIPVTIVFIIGLVLVYFVQPGQLVFAIIAGLLMMFGYISLSSVLNSLVRNYIPKGKEGSFMGIRMIFVVMIPMCTGPYIGSALTSAFSTTYYTDFDGSEELLPSNLIWLVAAVVLLLIFIPLIFTYFYDKKRRSIENSGLFYEKEEHKEEQPLSDYPRVSLVRDSYMSLNGLWDITMNKSSGLECEYTEKCLVPYPIESAYSLINRGLNSDEYIHYKKEVTLDKNFKKYRLILHLDGVDSRSSLYINKELVGTYTSGYRPIKVDITDKVKSDKFTIELVVQDKSDQDYVSRGKQSLNRGGIWYTSCSGIYKPVWLESVDKEYIKGIKITPLFDEKAIRVLIKTNTKDGVASIKLLDKTFGVEVNEEVVIDDLDLPEWNIDSPKLVDVEVAFNKDVVKTYFGFRKIEIKGNDIYLNNKKILINGLLYQGYFYKGNLTPYSYKDYEKDILNIKELGFNTIRCHIKVENELFYKYCDENGILVIQDIPNGGSKYKTLTTILGALPFRIKKNDHKYKTFSRDNMESRIDYEVVMVSTIKALYNHPSVIMYTLFNEGWGQFDSEENYQKAIAIDSSRIYDVNSGWYRNDFNEIESIHNYFSALKLPKTLQKPVILSEFGGYSYNEEGHFYGAKEFGYKRFKIKEKYNEAIKKLYVENIIPLFKQGLSGAIYTEYNDIEDEINGLYTYDRILKVDREMIKEINQEIRNLY